MQGDDTNGAFSFGGADCSRRNVPYDSNSLAALMRILEAETEIH